jgi:hypothetical protein
METHETVGPISRLAGGGYRTSVGGSIVILVVASGCALGLGAVVECLTTSDTTARASIAGAREVQLIPSAPDVVDGRQDAPGAFTDSSLANVFDGWYHDPLEATPGFRASEHGLRNDGAPNELRIFGK